MALKKTPRGFYKYGKFHDLADQEIRVQESSLATDTACWIFLHPGERTQEGFTPFHNDGLGNKIYPALHLNVKMAKKLIKELEMFIENNRFTE